MADVEDDLSASTARFRAFAEGAKEEELPSPWRMRAPASKVAIMTFVVVLVAVVVALLARLLVG
jgi:hypothetical protein